MDTSKDKITRIIKALLAKAAGTDNEAEAAIFAAKASEMMEQFQIEVLDADDPVDMSLGFKGRSDGPTRYKARLCSAVGMYYGCRTVFSRLGTQLTIKLIGRESSRITAELMFPFMLEQCRHAAKEVAKDTGEGVSVCERDVINALITRLEQLINEQHRRTVQPQTKAGKNALVVQDAIKAKMGELFSNLKPGKASRISTSEAARTAAAGISLNKQAGKTDVKYLK